MWFCNGTLTAGGCCKEDVVTVDGAEEAVVEVSPPAPAELKLPEPVATQPDGEEGTMKYRLRFKDAKGGDVSPWHDVPLHTGEDGVFNCIVEIPKMTRHKMEVNTKEPGSPIAQDVKKGKLRDYHGPIFWNYGMFPQTWEDPHVEHPELEVNGKKVKGDNDPLDAVEIGSEPLATGTVARVKVLGALAMIDDGELDWKVVAIALDDPMASELDSIADVEAKMPGVVSGIREWFRWYKTPDGKPLNTFGFGGEALDQDAAVKVIEETHDSWKSLRSGNTIGKGLWTGMTQQAA